MANLVWRSTLINTFFQCPRLFYLKYVATPQDDNKFDNDYLKLGRAVHKVLEEAIKGTAPVMVLYRELLEHVPESMRADFLDMYPSISDFIEQLKNRDDIHKILIEKTYYIDSIALQGTIDLAILRPDGTAELIDHKTNKSATVTGEIKRQLSIYGLFLTNYEKAEAVEAKVHFVRHGVVRKVYEKDATQVRQDGVSLLLDFKRELKSQIGKWEPRPSWKCRFCPFLKTCPEGQARVKV